MATMHYEARNIDKDAYDAVIDCIADMSKHGFEHMNIQNHATNNTMLRLIKTSLTLDVIKSKVQEIYPKVIEELFSKYHNIAFRYCLQKTRNSDVSNEIAQETITRLLRTQNRIDKVENWVIKVAHNILCEHYRGQKQEQELYRDLMCETSLLRQISDHKDRISIEQHLHSIPPHILKGKNYKSYLQLKEHEDLKAYAMAHKLSYEAAKSKSKKIIRDLKAEILLSMGWEATPDILDYRQYKAIQSFIRKLLAIFNVNEMDRVDQLGRLHPDLPEVLDGYTNIIDWGISLIEERMFRLYLVHLGAVPPPLLSTIIVFISKSNHVSIKQCKRNIHAGSHTIPPNAQIPKQMGRALWSYEVIVSHLNENNR